MSLYVRVYTDFWHHRKTARLRSMIGDDALWIPLRLWSYSAEHQVDGDFSNYSSEEMAMLLGCSKYATSIKESLVNAGFLNDNGKIHDWSDHNGFHATNSKRAKLAAEKRWEKQKEKKQKKDNKKERGVSNAEALHQQCASNATSMLGASVVEAWNTLGKPFSKVEKLTDKRLSALNDRLSDPWWKDNFSKGIQKVKVSSFCQGKNNREWVLDFDFFIHPDSLPKIIEGKYDNKNGSSLPQELKPAPTREDYLNGSI